MSDWKPQDHRLLETPVRGSKSKLRMGLEIAVNILKAHNHPWKPVAGLRDQHGTYAYTGDSDTFKVTLLGRNAPFGNLISAGEDVLDRSVDEHRWLFVYLKSANRIYVFDPEQCREKGVKRTRGSKIFIDFPLKLGVNLLLWLERLEGKPEGLEEFMPDEA